MEAHEDIYDLTSHYIAVFLSELRYQCTAEFEQSKLSRLLETPFSRHI